MTKVIVQLAIAGLLAGGVLAQSVAPPAISPRGVANAASRMPPSLPAGGIARGAIFHIAGPRLGPAKFELAEQGTPIPSLGGVSVEIEHVPVPLFYADQTRIVARMPENVPLGIGKLTVSFRGQTSQEFSVGVVASAFGIFSTLREAELPSATREQIRRGEPTTNYKPPVVGTRDRFYIYGTGLGTARNPRVWLGGKRASHVTVTNVDRFPGLQRIAVDPPRSVATGCYVPILVEAYGLVSNASAIGISEESCVEVLPWLSEAVAGERRSGTVLLLRSSLTTDVRTGFISMKNATFHWENIAATFSSVETQRAAPLPLPPPGTCTAYSGTLQMGALVRSATGVGTPDDVVGIAGEVNAPPTRSLDAGNALTVQGPEDTRHLPRNPSSPGSYASVVGGRPPVAKVDPQAPFLEARKEFRLLGSGGADVGPFSQPVILGDELNWRNPKSVSVVKRDGGVKVRWDRTAAGRMVIIAVTSTDEQSGALGAAVCIASPSQHSFRVPPHVLANLPTGKAGVTIPTNLVIIGQIPIEPQRFSAPGLDTGLLVDITTALKTVVFR